VDSVGIEVGGGARGMPCLAMKCVRCCRIVLVIDCWRVVYDSKLTRRKLMCASNCCLRAEMVFSCWGRLVPRSVRRLLCCSAN
jgi:hypothetical protein